MAIDLIAGQQQASHSDSTSLARTQQNRQQAIQTSLRALNLQTNHSTEGLVKSVTIADQTLRNRLQQLVLPNVPLSANVPLSNSSANHSTTAKPASNLAQLLQSAQLKVLEVAIKGQTVLALTDQPIKTGQSLNLALQGQSLKILSEALSNKTAANPAATNTASTNPAASNATSNPNLTKALSNAPLSEGLKGNSLSSSTTNPASLDTPGANTSDSKALTAQQQSTLQSHLRSLLPLFNNPHSSNAEQQLNTKALQNLMQAALALTVSSQTNFRASQAGNAPPRSLQESLQQLAQHIRTPSQLSNPQQLRHILQSAGAQTERQLHSSTNQATPPAADLKTAVLQLLRQLSTNNGRAASLPILTNDLRATGRQPTEAHLTGLNFGTPNALSTRQLDPQLLLQLSQWLQQLASATSPQTNGQPETPPNLQQLLHQQAQMALNKLVFHQLQSLQRSQSSEQSPLHLQTEIPVRIGQEIHPLHIHIEERWHQHYQEEESSGAAQASRAQKVRQWLVKLAFELPQAGTLHAHITVLQDQVSTTLWAEQAYTWELAQQQLQTLHQRLEKDGCKVNKLECLAGKPVETQIQMNYSLVDIKT